MADFPLTPAEMTLTAYRRRVRRPEDLFACLAFRAENSKYYVPRVPEELKGAEAQEAQRRREEEVNALAKKNSAYRSFFTKALKLYITGIGHPPGSEGVVSQDAFDKGMSDPVCRANTLLLGMTETLQLPLRNDTITVSFFSLLKRRSNIHLTFKFIINTDSMYLPFTGDLDRHQPGAFRIGTCARQAIVFYNPILHKWIHDRFTGDTAAINRFDAWIHTQLHMLEYNVV
jgi:hypothetical protein